MNQEEALFSKKKLMNYLVLTIVFIIISYLSILFIYHHLSGHTAMISLKQLHVNTWVLLIFLLILFYLFDTLRLYYILRTLHVKISFFYMFKLTFINIFISNITPFATGGGFAQVYFLNRKGVPLGDAVAASTMRTILPIIFFFITTPFILLFNKEFLALFSGQPKIYIYLLIILYLVIAYGFYEMVRKPKILKYIVYKILQLLSFFHLMKKAKINSTSEKINHEIEAFSNHFRHFLKGNKIHVFLTIFLTITYLFILFLFPVLLLKGLHYHINTLTVISLQIVITFLTYFAPTPGATGVAEGGFSFIFSYYVQKQDLIFLTFTWRFFTMYLGILIGLVVFYYEMLIGSRRKKEVVS